LAAVIAAPGSHRVWWNDRVRVLEVVIEPGGREPEHNLEARGRNGGALVLAARLRRRDDSGMSGTRQVLVLAIDGCHSLNVFGPLEVFYGASIEVPGAYDVLLVGPTDGGIVRTDTGVPLGVAPLPEPPPRHDTLVIAGAAGMVADVNNRELVDWVARASRRARRTVSVCTGAFLLAAAGVLDDRPAVTHWAYCAQLQRSFADVHVDADPVYINDGDVWTSAGSTAGIDLSLALVEQDLGSRVAVATARRLVMFLKRPGGQSQFSRALSAQQAARNELRDLQAWITEHLDGNLTIPVLADRAAMSERSFSRAFLREVGQSPAAYVEDLRIERARDLLEDGARSLDTVAHAVGFASQEVLRRAFQRRLGVSPSAYRDRFSTHAVSGGRDRSPP
jgi:transcriptional regulator GlxA family with amidase domain